MGWNKEPMGFNPYEINGDIVTIFLYRRDTTKPLECYINIEDLPLLIEFDHRFSSKYNTKSKTYYASTRFEKPDGKIGTKLMHNIIMDTSEIVHHRDHNGLNNTRKNMFVTSNQDNSTKRHGLNKNNKSGYRNVCWAERDETWIVQLQINGINTKLGTFSNVDEAGKFAEKMREKYYILD